MANPLYDVLGKNSAGPFGNILSAFQQFKSTFSGDPEKQVQALLQSGQMSQEQYNQLAQTANSLIHLLK